MLESVGGNTLFEGCLYGVYYTDHRGNMLKEHRKMRVYERELKPLRQTRNNMKSIRKHPCWW